MSDQKRFTYDIELSLEQLMGVGVWARRAIKDGQPPDLWLRYRQLIEGSDFLLAEYAKCNLYPPRYDATHSIDTDLAHVVFS